MHFSRVVIASRYPVVLLGLNCLLEAQRDFRVAARCNDSASCFKAIRALVPDIAILDISMPDIFEQALASAANSSMPAVRLVFLATSVDDRDLAMLAEVGAFGVVLSEEEPEAILQTLRQVGDGQKMLPAPSSEVGISSGRSAIAEKYLSVLTDRERQIMIRDRNLEATRLRKFIVGGDRKSTRLNSSH